MFDIEKFTQELFSTHKDNFETKSLELFSYQYQTNATYRHYCTQLNKHPANVQSLQEIPFLPISFFKSHHLKCGTWETEKIFKSSGTTGMKRSQHHCPSEAFYLQNTEKIFEQQYGALSGFEILALLPSYQEQGDSSLISMVDHFITSSKPESRYYLHQENELIDRLSKPTSHKKLLIGVSFALLDLAEKHNIETENLIVMETGGMKGRRKELIREELHQILRDAFHVAEIHSEYGMTELSSQAYGSSGHFTFPSWCAALTRDINDPFSYVDQGKTGGLNIIDLANVHTCAFIETKDLGRQVNSDQFDVLGRFDNSDIRGCNLLV